LIAKLVWKLPLSLDWLRFSAVFPSRLRLQSYNVFFNPQNISLKNLQNFEFSVFGEADKSGEKPLEALMARGILMNDRCL